jgi:hypothetical protein
MPYIKEGRLYPRWISIEGRRLYSNWNVKFLNWMITKPDPWGTMADNCFLWPTANKGTYELLIKLFWEEYLMLDRHWEKL